MAELTTIARPYAEADLIATVMTETHGAHRGLVRAGAARAHAGTWQPGNFVQVRWTGRLADQLGAFEPAFHEGAQGGIDRLIAA